MPDQIDPGPLTPAIAANARGDLRVSAQLALEVAERAHIARVPDLVAAAALVTFGVPDPGTAAIAERMCQLALTSAERLDAARCARLHARLAVALHHAERFDDAERHLLEAERLTVPDGSPLVAAAVLHARLLSIAGTDRGAELRTGSERMLHWAQDAGAPEAELAARVWRIDALMRSGDTNAAGHELDALEVLVARTGAPLARWNLLVARAGLGQAIGRLHDAAADAQAARVTLPPGQRPHTEPLYVAQVMLVATEAGTVPPEIDVVRGLAMRNEVIAAAMVGRYDLEMGDRVRAIAAFDAIRPRLDGIPMDRRGLPILFAAAWLAIAAGDLDAAREVRDRLSPFAGSMIASPLGAVGPVDAASAVISGGLGEHDAAVSQARSAIDLCARGGFRPWLERSRFIGAEAHLARGGSGDRTIARRLVASATVGAADLGMVHLADRGRSLEARMADAPMLSAREREIAILVAQGATNREVGGRLFISDRTVESHVQHIMDKLGIRSRTQIAGWVVAEGLAPGQPGRGRGP